MKTNDPCPTGNTFFSFFHDKGQQSFKILNPLLSKKLFINYKSGCKMLADISRIISKRKLSFLHIRTFYLHSYIHDNSFDDAVPT